MIRSLPVAVTLLVGWFLVAQYFIPHAAVAAWGQRIATWVPIVAAVGLALGAVSLFELHVGRIRRKHPDRFYSLVTLGSMLATVVAGLVPGEAFESASQWIYRNMLAPLRASINSLLAFYLASASYRAFRLRSKEAVLLFAAALVVMLGNIPWVGLLAPWIPQASRWILDVPMTAALRGITIGVGLGMVVLSLRILLARDRSYLGGGE